MVSLDEAVVIRHKTHGENYEIFVDADRALDYKSGEDIKLSEILASDTVFKDASAAEKASEEHLLKLYGASDMQQVLKAILVKGQLHLTTEQKRRMHDERFKQVASIIAQNAINPQTGSPHPLNRIEAAMQQAKVEIVMHKSAKEQVDKVLKKLKPILPIKFERLRIALHIPANHAGKLYHLISEIAQLVKEDWKGQDQYLLVEIPAGMQDELFTRINGATHGEVEAKVVKHE